MSGANSSVPIMPGSGIDIAAHVINGKQHQIVVQADSDGQVLGSIASYFYATPAAAVGANKLYLDLFNAVGSGKVVDIRGIWVIPKTDVAVTGALGIRIDLYRTSTVGTGGTAAVYKSATPDVAGGCINPMNTVNPNLPAQITARHLPTGGTTISAWIFPTYSLGEESATSQAYISQYQNILPSLTWGQKFAIREGEGILLKQGAVAATGSIAFLIAFTVE